MYQKIKYIIIATMFLLICVVVLTLDANTRYNAMQKEKNEKRQITQAALQNYYAQQSQSEKNNTQSVPDEVMKKFQEQNQSTVSPDSDDEDDDSDDSEFSSANMNRYNNFSVQENNPQQNENTASSKTLEPLETPTGGYFTDTSEKKLDNYKFEKVFKLNQEEYAIISDTNNTNLSSSSYCQKKFYIYKKVDNAYKMSNYLFDITESTNAGPAQITIEDRDGTLIINYSGSTHLKRTVDNYQLKSSYRQFESTYPALIYNEPPQEEIQQQNSLDLQP